jgi:bacillithiol biosynthesis cysteine-adding enzyme BshC
MIQVVTRDFGGSPLVRSALARTVPDQWYAQTPASSAEWAAAARDVVERFSGHDWLGAISAACDASGAASERLERVAREGGVVITTGQQPGLFGGPIYTWSKAFSALALADEFERRTGIPAAPVFWAATDDTDYAEASYTVVVHSGEARTLRMSDRQAEAAMAVTPIGDISGQLIALTQAAGSAIDPEPLECVRNSYVPGQTVGGAYLSLLRMLLHPLGITVLDASHPSVRAAADPTLRNALSNAASIRDALAERGSAMESLGYRVQVQPVPNLSLVFRTNPDYTRSRIPVKDAIAVAASANATELGPNVLLRPIVERQILPTVTYVAGPSELAYFAQTSAVADAMALSRPLAVARWSGVIVEPHVQDILQRLGICIADFQDPHAIESRIAREELPAAVRQAINVLRSAVLEQAVVLRDSHSDNNGFTALRRAVNSFEVQVEHRISRLERRYAAAVKRSGNARLHEVSVARASLFPNGVPQERALNFIPLLARYGRIVRDQIIALASQHARALIGNG